MLVSAAGDVAFAGPTLGVVGHCGAVRRRPELARQGQEGTKMANYVGRGGRKPALPLDRSIERSMLVVNRALTLDEVIQRYVASVLVACNGNITAASRTLNISRNSLKRVTDHIEN